jgi:hypothetical protein
MKKYVITFCFIVQVLIIVPLVQSSADEGVFATTVEPFLVALQDGDIPALKSYMSGELFSNITQAAQQDEDYGSFLRQRYANATFSSVVKQETDKQMLVSVDVNFAGEGSSPFELVVEKDGAGIWHVVDQYTPVERP